MSSLLLVHDDPDILDWLTTLFEANGFEVSIGATAFAARSKLERTEVSAILAGLDVGGGAGHSLIDWAETNRPELLTRLLVLAENEADRTHAQNHKLSALSPDDYGGILEWVSMAVASGAPTPVTGFEAEAPRPPTLLLVEDDPHQARFMSSLLKDYGFAIESCESPTEARARISNTSAVPIDVVLSDWYMGDESGEALYTWMLEERPGLLERVIFITGGSLREIREKAPLASCYPKGQDSRVLIAALTRAARRALR